MTKDKDLWAWIPDIRATYGELSSEDLLQRWMVDGEETKYLAVEAYGCASKWTVYIEGHYKGQYFAVRSDGYYELKNAIADAEHALNEFKKHHRAAIV